MHLEWPKLHIGLAVLSAIGLGREQKKRENSIAASESTARKVYT